MTKRLLAAVDGSDSSTRSIETMLSLATEFKSPPEIVLVAVEVALATIGGMGFVGDSGLLEAEIAEDIDASLKSAEARVRAAGLAVTIRREQGDAADRILRAAAESGCSMIFIGRRGLGAFGKLLLGSVSDQVLKGAAMPVVVTH